jgi:hypothetical protein
VPDEKSFNSIDTLAQLGRKCFENLPNLLSVHDQFVDRVVEGQESML